MSDFNEWYNYMIEKGYLSEIANRRLLKIAFDAGVQLGHYEGASLCAISRIGAHFIDPPFWCKDARED